MAETKDTKDAKETEEKLERDELIRTASARFGQRGHVVAGALALIGGDGPVAPSKVEATIPKFLKRPTHDPKES